MTKSGNFTFVLHTHLPYVISHGRWPHGTDWLNEAVAEAYIPLLNVVYDLVEEGYSPKITFGITPVLAEQLSTELFKKEFEAYLHMKINAAKDDQLQFSRFNQLHLLKLAEFWENFYDGIGNDFKDRYNSNIIGAFKRMQDEGHIEIVTCGATHGYFPLLSHDVSIQAQVKQGIQTYENHFGRKPRGFWLPECGYRPRYEWVSPMDTGKKTKPYLRKGVEEFLTENEIDYFFVDSHLLRGGRAIGVYLARFEALQRLWGQFSKQYIQRAEDTDKTPYEVYLVSSAPETKKPVAVFTRDPRTALQVWSGEWGYPGDGWYLDFHKKHFPGGHRYWRVTSAKSDLADKREYEPEKAAQRIPENASHFVGLITQSLKEHYQQHGTPGIVCALFDSELLGHWWFEGPRWLYQVLKQLNESVEVTLCTCSEFLDSVSPTSVITLPEGSWGEGGFHYIWLNDCTKWTWKYIYEAERRMHQLAKEFAGCQDAKLYALLKQMARELLLLQSSDWQFLISTWSARDYAEARISEHYHNFMRLTDIATRYGRNKTVDEGDWNFVAECESTNNLFNDIKPEWYEKVEYPV